MAREPQGDGQSCRDDELAIRIDKRDAVGDQAQEPHDANLLDCQRRYAEVTTTDACIEYLASLAAA